MTQYVVPFFLNRLNVFEEATPDGAASFSCGFKAHPQPVVTWYKDDLPISGDVRISISEESIRENETNLSLTIQGVTKKDEGSYRCSLENSEGVASTTGYLSVLDISARINDPDPIDQSLIDSLLLRSSSQDQSKSIISINHQQPLVATKESTSEDSINHIDELSEIEAMMSRMLDNYVQLDDSNSIFRKSNNYKHVAKNDEIKSKKSATQDISTINVYTIMNSDKHFYESFKPIQVTKFDTKQHIPENDVNHVNSLPIEAPSDRLETYENLRTMNYYKDHNKVGDFKSMRQKFDPKREEEKMNEERHVKEFEEVAAQRSHVVGDNLHTHKHHHHHHHHQDYSPEDKLRTPLEDFSKEIYKSSGDKVISGSKTTSWKKASKNKLKDFAEPEEKSPKVMKWLKARGGMVPEQDAMEGRVEENPIMTRKRVSRSSKKVYYERNEEDYRDESPQPPPIDVLKTEPPFDLSSQSDIPPPCEGEVNPPEVAKSFADNDQILLDEKYASLFKFPKVLILIFIVMASIYLLSIGYSTWSVGVMVALSWTTTIIFVPYLRMYLEACDDENSAGFEREQNNL